MLRRRRRLHDREDPRPGGAQESRDPVTARRLADLGIGDEGELRRIGPVAAYRRLKFAYPRETTLVALYALHGAVTDTPWTAIPAEVKQDLRRSAAEAGPR